MQKQEGNAGIGIFGLLGVIFIVLKLLGVEPVAAWSWWWVTSPIWISVILTVVVILAFMGFAGWVNRR